MIIITITIHQLKAIGVDIEDNNNTYYSYYYHSYFTVVVSLVFYFGQWSRCVEQSAGCATFTGHVTGHS